MLIRLIKDLVIGMVVITPWAIPMIGLDFGTTIMMEEYSTIVLDPRPMYSLVEVVPATTKQLPVLGPMCK